MSYPAPFSTKYHVNVVLSNIPRSIYKKIKVFIKNQNFKIQKSFFLVEFLKDNTVEPPCSGHVSIADTFFRNQLSPAMAKPLDFEPLNSGHLPIADTFSEIQWCPLLRGFTV